MDLPQPGKGEKSMEQELAVCFFRSGSLPGVPTYVPSVSLGGGTAAMGASDVPLTSPTEVFFRFEDGPSYPSFCDRTGSVRLTGCEEPRPKGVKHQRPAPGLKIFMGSM